MNAVTTAIQGLLLIDHQTRGDERGSFTKVFRRDLQPFAGIERPFAECFFSISAKDVLRGLHFQLPPHDHEKLVTCIEGEVFDCVVDLRRSSPSAGRAFHCRLVPGHSLLVPRGCAHGFCALADGATLLYHVTTVHSPEHDAGIHWSSVDVPWPVSSPIVSSRDARLPHLSDFQSPFD